MDKLAPIVNVLGKTLHPFKVGSVSISPTYWQAISIVVLLFLLVFMLARMRFLYVHWSLGKHAISMFFWGFLFAVVFEGVLMVGGRTIFTELMGMKNVPKPLSTLLDIGRNRLVAVLGVKDQIPSSDAQTVLTSEELFSDYRSLPASEAAKLYKLVCKP